MRNQSHQSQRFQPYRKMDSDVRLRTPAEPPPQLVEKLKTNYSRIVNSPTHFRPYQSVFYSHKVARPLTMTNISGHRTQKGFTFSNLDRPGLEKIADFPGPGTYDSKSIEYHNVSYSFGGKHKEKVQAIKQVRHIRMKRTGPGKYELPGLSETGQYFYSKFGNSRCGKMSHEKRFTDRKDMTPGPGFCKPSIISDQADEKLQINKLGTYNIDKYRNSRVRSFGRETRMPQLTKSNGPGPGHYFIASSF